MPDATMAEYRTLRALARRTFGHLVDALNRRDTLDDLLRRGRHPLADDRRAYLTDRLAEARHAVEHAEAELTTYEYRLQGLERRLGLDDQEPRPRPTRPVATQSPTHQPSLFGESNGESPV